MQDRSSGPQGGACIWRSLNYCVPNVLSIQELDNQIDLLLVEKNKEKEFFPNKFLREWCGTEGQSWHQDCILKALKQKYGVGQFCWAKQKNRDIIFEKNKGKFYVHGLLNQILFPEINNPNGNWSHTICVDTDLGKYFDESAPNGRSVEKWLKKSKYLIEIHRVYKLEIFEEKVNLNSELTSPVKNSTLGLRYHGGKKRIGDKLATFIFEETQRRKYTPLGYCEPFCGMLGVYGHILPLFNNVPSCLTFLASDLNKSLILMWQALQKNWIPPTKHLTPTRFFKMKQTNVSSALKGYYGHFYGYMGKYFVTYDTAVTPKSAILGSKRMVNMGKKITKISFSHGPYSIQSHLKNYVLYLDSPYIEYSQYYQEGAKPQPKLNFPEFWDWCRLMAKTNLVFISAYSAPADFKVVFEIKSKTPSSYRMERLYMI